MDLFKKILWASLFLMGGGMMVISSALVNAEFDIVERTQAYIIENILSVTALTLMTIGIIYWLVEEFKKKNEDYLSAMGHVTSFIKEKYRPTIWTRFAIKLNKERKIKQYEEVLRVDLHHLESAASQSDILLWDEGLCDRTKEHWKLNTYCQQRTYIEKRLDSKWLETNIHTVEVNFDEVTVDVVISGEYFPKKLGKVRQVNDFVTKGKSFKLIRSRIPMIIFGTAMIMFITSIVMNFDWTISTFVTIGFKILAMTWNAIISVKFSEDWNNNVTLNDAMFQAGIAQEYDYYIKDELKKKEGVSNGN